MKRVLFRERWVGYELRTPRRRLFFALGIVLAVLPLGYMTVRLSAVGTLGAFQKRKELRRAIALDPANPRLYRRLALLSEASSNAAPATSVSLFQKAVALDPRDGLLWEGLARACERLRNERCATASLSRALALEPMTPRVEWLAANHDLLLGLRGEAASHFRRLLAIDPRYANAVFATSLSAYGKPASVGARVLPEHASASLRLEYLDFLAQHGDFQAAAQIWFRLTSSQERFGFPAARPYLAKLISSGHITQAVGVWHDLRRLGILSGEQTNKVGNLIFNPGFEHNPLNAGFGWRVRNVRYVDAQFADPDAYQGSRCLRIDFQVSENRSSVPVYQLVPVSPNRAYTLSARVRSQDVTSTSGPRLRVADPDNPNCLRGQTPETLGTTPWHEVSVTFSTCAQTRLVRLSVWRPRSYHFPNNITGHFWVDDVRLVVRRQTAVPPAVVAKQ